MHNDSIYDDASAEEGKSAQPDLAMEWVVRIDRGLTPVENEQFQSWINQRPSRTEEYSQALRTWQKMDQLSAVADLAAASEAVMSQALERKARRQKVSLVSLLAVAAAVAIAWIPSQHFLSRITQTVATSLPEKVRVIESSARRQTLTDGSVVELNGDSRIAVEFTTSERRVTLVKGEAHFFVAKDAVHPFLVTAAGVTVRAVGTAFNVRLATGSVDVLVTEGKIQLNGPALDQQDSEAPHAVPSLVAGERASVDTVAAQKAYSIHTVSAQEIDTILDWQATRLVFDNTPLSEVIAAFNCYNKHKLILDAPGSYRRSLSGVFRANNVEAFVRLLKSGAGLTAQERSENETVLRPAR